MTSTKAASDDDKRSESEAGEYNGKAGSSPSIGDNKEKRKLETCDN